MVGRLHDTAATNSQPTASPWSLETRLDVAESNRLIKPPDNHYCRTRAAHLVQRRDRSGEHLPDRTENTDIGRVLSDRTGWGRRLNRHTPAVPSAKSQTPYSQRRRMTPNQGASCMLLPGICGICGFMNNSACCPSLRMSLICRLCSQNSVILRPEGPMTQDSQQERMTTKSVSSGSVSSLSGSVYQCGRRCTAPHSAYRCDSPVETCVSVTTTGVSCNIHLCTRCAR